MGKTAIIEELAGRIKRGDVPDKLKNKKILSLSMASCVAGTKYRGEFEERMNKMLKELERSDDIIIFIDEVHTLVGAGGAEGAIDASNILKPALARNKIKVIGATTIKEYKETISKDKALNRRFQTVFINENTKEETINILLNLKKLYEDYHQVIIKDEIINKIVTLTDKYLTDKCNPDKSIDILDMVCTKVSLKESKKKIELKKLKNKLFFLQRQKNNLIMHHHFNDAVILKKDEMKLIDKINNLSLEIDNQRKKIININDVKEIIESKTKIPIYEVSCKNSKLRDIETILKKEVIGQDKVIEKISKVTKKIMLGFKDNLPYSFLFVGPSGVGKTMLVKEYSKFLHIPLIRLDMSEYKESSSISKIIGSPPGYIGYNDVDTVLEKIKNNPYCLLLLDEIEKCCHEVINLFLQALDEGIITDSHGNKVNLSHIMIIMTSNIGSNKEKIGFMKEDLDHEELKNILSTPIVNRINSICYFNNLTKEDIFLILKKRLKNLENKYQIKVDNKKELINKIIDESDIDSYGARQALKQLDDKIDDYLLDKIYCNNKKYTINQ